MGRPKIIGTCSVENCDKSISSVGLCQYHYNKKRLEANPEKANSGLRGHPLYVIWWQRKRDNLLCEAWLDFRIFIKDVGEKPGEDFFLVRFRNENFGPDNFIWKEHLRKREDESFTQWWARKRDARITANPAMESDRNIMRRYGLTREQYNDKLDAQDDKCAICGNEETSIDGRTGTVKALAVDHCHKSGKIRDLLCWRCNTIIGRIDEEIELLHKMINYLKKHKEIN